MNTILRHTCDGVRGHQCERSMIPQIDTELHFLNQCPIFDIERACVFEKINENDINFSKLNEKSKCSAIGNSNKS